MHSNSLFLISVGLVVLLILLRLVTKGEKKLFYIVLTALFLHLALLVIMQFDLNSRVRPYLVQSKFYNDGETYSANAWIIANTLKGEPYDASFFFRTPGIQTVITETVDAAKKFQIAPVETYEVGYITYLYAVIYAAYGYAPGFLNFINICASIFTAIIVFFIAKHNFNRITAYIACSLVLFWPTMFYYGTTKLKDPLLTLVIYLVLFFWLNIKNKAWAACLTVGLLPVIWMLRGYYVVPFALVILAGIGLRIISMFSIKLRVVGLAAITSLVVFSRQAIYSFLLKALRTCATRHYIFWRCGGVVYALYGSEYEFMSYNVFGWLGYLSRGWFHLIFEPLFSSGYSFSIIGFYPFKIIFALLFFFSIAGLVISLRENNRNNFLLVSFFLAFGTIFALVEANIGTMLRHRDLIIPVTFIYAAFFISKILPKINFNKKTGEQCVLNG